MPKDEIPFHRTTMGKRFYQCTLPSLVNQLKKLNENLEKAMGAVDGFAGPLPKDLNEDLEKVMEPLKDDD